MASHEVKTEEAVVVIPQPKSATCEGKEIPNCGTCVTSGNTCETCDPGYTLGNNGAECNANVCDESVTNCIACIAANGTECQVCKAGYEVNAVTKKCAGITCETPTTDCKFCVAKTGAACAVCEAGYALDSAKKECKGIACITPIAGCEFCSEGGRECAVCKPGYNGETISAKLTCTEMTCKIVIPFCDVCATDDTCAKCKKGYALNGDGSECEGISCDSDTTSAGCEYCVASTGDVCAVCEFGYNATPSGNGVTCAEMTCKTTIKNCEVCSSDTTCIYCSEGYTGSKCDRCATGYSVKDTAGVKTCVLNTCKEGSGPANCGFCDKPDGTVCIMCDEESIFHGEGDKKECMPNCLNDVVNCDLCKTTATCTTCEQGYAGETCTKIDCTAATENCDLCETTTKCLTCEQGYKATTTDNGVTCTAMTCKTTIPKCELCASDTTCAYCEEELMGEKCDRCTPGYTVKDTAGVKTCEPNSCKVDSKPDSCEHCDKPNGTVCAVCSEDYILYGEGDAVVCMPNCLGNAEYCDLCRNENFCEKCELGYRGPTCVQIECPIFENCDLCEAPDKCAVCKDGYQNPETECLEMKCAASTKNCLQCTEPNGKVCKACAKKYTLKNGECSGGLSGGAIAGIVIGVVAVVAGAAVGIYFLVKKSGAKKTGVKEAGSVFQNERTGDNEYATADVLVAK